MKTQTKVVAILAVVLLAGCAKPADAESIDPVQLQHRNGIAYQVNDPKPYSGKAVVFYDNGQKKEETDYVNGKDHGKYISWYDNGQKEDELDFVNGKPD